MKFSRFFALTGFLIFIAIVWNLDIGEIFTTLSRMDPFYFTVSLLLMVPAIFLRGLKWKVIISSYDVDYSLSKSTSASMVGIFIGAITPGRIGDLARAYYLRDEMNISSGKSLATVIVDRIIDMGLLFILAIAGLLLIAINYFAVLDVFFAFFLFFALFLLAIAIIRTEGVMKAIMKPVSRFFIPSKHKQKASTTFHDFYEGIKGLRKSKMSLSVIVGLLSWAVSIIQFYTISLALGLGIDILFFVAVAPVIGLVNILPISVSGIGTRDAALVFFFALISASAESAVSLSFMILLLNYVISGLIGFVFWVKKPVKLF